MERLWNWKGWRGASKTVCFLLLLALALGRANEVLALKSYVGLYDSMQKFYEQPENMVDVLVLGSSHAYVNIESGTLWDEYGIPSYILGSSMQPTWNSFYYLNEALKTQRPRLIVMDAYMTVFTQEYSDNGRAVSSTFGMKWSRDKAEAMRVSAPPDKLSSFLLGYTQYHARTRELSREDFLKNRGDEARYGCWKGSTLAAVVTPQEWPADVQTEERAPMTEKTEMWYRKTIELAQASNIPLLIVLTPYPGITTAQQAIFNTAADVASEYGVPFVNYNLDFQTLGLNPSRDYYDGAHMNIWGARKFAKILGAYLTDSYDLLDRRGDPAYQSWEDNARYTRAYVRDTKLAPDITPEAAASLLQDPDFTCAVSVSGNGAAIFAPLLRALGVPAGEAGIWLVSSGQILWDSGTAGEVYFELDYHDLKLTVGPGGNGMMYDRQTLQPTADGVSIFVYDTVTQAQAAYLTFDTVASN